MKIVESTSSRTNKYIHDDGSETSIKRHLSGEYLDNGMAVFKDNNKYSVVVSCSTGCQMNCTFCHLTQKEAKFSPISLKRLISNIKQSILAEFQRNPDISSKKIKLCWMGMGDALTSLRDVSFATVVILDWVLVNNYAAGVDGVDISTVLPKLPDRWVSELGALDEYLDTFFDHTSVRLFYSLHSVDQAVRDKIIPNAMPLHKTIPLLKRVNRVMRIPVILHYMFMEGINDSPEQVKDLKRFIAEKGLEGMDLRILRYNSADPSIVESPAVFEILQTIPIKKVQFSAGADILSACGQFVVDYD